MLKKCCLSLLCMLVYSTNVGSSPYSKRMQRNLDQSPPLLSLSGRIVGGEIDDTGGGDVKLTLKLHLDIKNAGTTNALILRREPVVVERAIIATPSSATEKKYLYSLRTLPSVSRSPEWEELQQYINKSSPPPDAIRNLAPGETYTLELTDWFYVDRKANIDSSSRLGSAIRQPSPVWLQMTLQVWSGDIERNVDRDELKFSRMLKKRWQQFGELQLENLKSEPMPLNLASFPLSSARVGNNKAGRQQ